MNKLGELFYNIPDEELKQAIIELDEDGVKGIYRTDGLLRKYAKLASDIISNGNATDLFMTEINLLRQGALRWAKVSNEFGKGILKDEL